mmetsp:Transcript_15894/g.15292  ORF Transcript_15894/g.15292 Transcript_15894/m.15292 type:complete len:82 (+) Transcript_15894:329-574(+)
MLMADMQHVVNSQQEMLIKLKSGISHELDKRQVVHATFQVQHQVEDMLKSFESKIIQSLMSLRVHRKIPKGRQSTLYCSWW